MNNNGRKTPGISLFELLLSIVLLSVLLCIGYNSFDREIRSENVKSAAEQIVLAIKNARCYARSKGITTSVNFQTGENEYSISADGQVITNNEFFDSTSGKLPKNVEIIDSGCNSVNFYVDGSPVDSGGNLITKNCDVKVGYEDGPQKDITIIGNSGNVVYE